MRRVAAATVLAALAACTSGGGRTPSVTPSSPHPSVAPVAGPSAAAEMAKLCPKLPPFPKRIRPSATVPAVVARIEREVESVRDLRFAHPVAVAAVTPAEMTARVEKASTDTLPAGQVRRRTLAWETIGVLPRGTDLGSAVRRFLGTQVAGYYDSHAKELVYIGSANPTPAEQFVLAHELVHALDDQHFDLSRVDALQAACHDEGQEAATGAIEGSAVVFSSLVALRYFTAAQRRQVQRANSGSPPKGIPQFLLNMESWPYVDGPSFIGSLFRQGGPAAVDGALRRLPVTTSEVMHPQTYPSEPAAVDVPDLAGKLGAGWRDLDVQEVGEQWLLDMLELRLDPSEARPAAEGWTGGVYRAWTDGTHAAVLLRTRWGTARDAQEFVRAVQDWIRSGQRVAVRPTGFTVDVLFASDAATLGKLKIAAGE